ncbi:MAG: hypothetical protein M3Z24_06840, partial [Chloroflexota bacterium]|nr:hypothetical protein [Chloroflexota bacterium]
MHVKNTCLIVNVRPGQDITKVTDLSTVLAAAGWKTDVELKEYGGEAMTIAAKAAEEDYDLIIAHGGDGTLNQVVNGVMCAKGKNIVGLIPAGTANEWAGEIGIPDDAMKAALTLVNSYARKVDLGYVAVQDVLFPENIQRQLPATRGKKSKKPAKGKSTAKHRFLLMAGLGLDADVISHTSKPLKERIGRLAFDVAAAKGTPQPRPFPVEIRAVTDPDKGTSELLWKGEGLQILVANTREYANVVDVAPNAYLDDGIIDICVITGGHPLKTLEQLASIVFRREIDTSISQKFRGAHLLIRVPASIKLQLDGSSVDLDDYVRKSDRKLLKQVQDVDTQSIMVDYRFDAEPHALKMAIPRTYNNTLFEKPLQQDQAYQVSAGQSGGDAALSAEQAADEQHDQGTLPSQEVPPDFAEHLTAVMAHGTKVKVVGVAPNPDKQETYIIAGRFQKQDNEEIEPVAICVDNKTTLKNASGQLLPLT